MFLYAQMLDSSVDVTITIRLASNDTAVVTNAVMTKITTDMFKYEFIGDVSQEYYFTATDATNNISASAVVENGVSKIESAMKGGWVKQGDGTIIFKLEDGSEFTRLKQLNKDGNPSPSGNWGLVP